MLKHIDLHYRHCVFRPRQQGVRRSRDWIGWRNPFLSARYDPADMSRQSSGNWIPAQQRQHRCIGETEKEM
jgi:hypothetical protein